MTLLFTLGGVQAAAAVDPFNFGLVAHYLGGALALMFGGKMMIKRSRREPSDQDPHGVADQNRRFEDNQRGFR